MSNIANLTLLQRTDRASIAAGLGIDTVTVINNYANGLDTQLPFKLSDMDADTLEAFKVVMDFFSYGFEAACPVVVVDYTSGTKTFDLSGSYLRDQVATDDVTPLADTTPVTVRFEVPGFVANGFVEVTALYGEAFSGPDLAAAAALGITITGDGTEFSISNMFECKAYFYKPEAVEGVYVIQYPAAETIIPAAYVP